MCLYLPAFGLSLADRFGLDMASRVALPPPAAPPKPAPAEEDEELGELAYCQPCEETAEPLQRHGSQRFSSVDDHELAWERYREAPASLFGCAGINAAGVQRIDLPFRPHEVDLVAEWLDRTDADGAAGLDALRPLHRLSRSDKLAAWRSEFSSLDLGTYEEAAAEDHCGLFSHLCWSLLLIEPHRSFPVHQHPDIEVEFVLRGALYENRLLSQPDAVLDASEVLDTGFPRLFSVHTHGGGSFFSNPRFSVHQSYTMDEGVVILVLWAGRHVNLTDPAGKLWAPKRCRNPFCPMGSTTFASLAAVLREQ